MAKEIEQEIFEEQRDEIKTLVGKIVGMIKAGETPNELVVLYRSMKPENFAYWLHGYYCAAGKHEALKRSEIFRFLREQNGH